jgi:hypothetical protein
VIGFARLGGGVVKLRARGHADADRYLQVCLLRLS